MLTVFENNCHYDNCEFGMDVVDVELDDTLTHFESFHLVMDGYHVPDPLNSPYCVPADGVGEIYIELPDN